MAVIFPHILSIIIFRWVHAWHKRHKDNAHSYTSLITNREVFHAAYTRTQMNLVAFSSFQCSTNFDVQFMHQLPHTFLYCSVDMTSDKSIFRSGYPCNDYNSYLYSDIWTHTSLVSSRTHQTVDWMYLYILLLLVHNIRILSNFQSENVTSADCLLIHLSKFIQ